MPFVGSTAKFDQLFLARLEPQNVENRQTEENIFTGDLEASNVFTSNIGISNLYPPHNFDLGTNLWMNDETDIVLSVKKQTQLERLFVENQIGVRTNNPLFAFQVGDTVGSRVFVDNEGEDLLVVEGNVNCTNLVSKSILVDGDITVDGNVSLSKITIDEGIEFGSNIAINDVGDPVLQITGNTLTVGTANIIGDLVVTGNALVTDRATYAQLINLSVSNAIIIVGDGNDGTFDTSIVFHQDPSNVFIGYMPNDEEIRMGRTDSGPADDNITILNEDVNVHVQGKLYTSNGIGASNLNPIHDLDVGANLYVEDTGSNVLHVSGNTYIENIKLGHRLQLGSNVVVDDQASNVFQVTGNAAFNVLFATERVGIANTNPIHTLCIGSNIHAHDTGDNAFVVHGRTVSDYFIGQSNIGVKTAAPQEALHVDGNIRLGGPRTVDANSEKFIKSTGKIVVHADDYGTDNTFNSLLLKSGAVTANVSSIEVSAGATSEATQFVKFTTKNTQRGVIDSQGRWGIGNVSPYATLTVGGDALVTGSNTLAFGNVWGTSQTGTRMYMDPVVGQGFIQSRVAANKGMNFNVTSGSSLGNTKLSILESNKVGINTATPEPVGLQVYGNVFVNQQVTANNNYNHELAAMTVTHQIPVQSTSDIRGVLNLCRQGTVGQSTQGARATLALGKYAISSGTSKTRLDFNLAENDYAVAQQVMTVRSDGKVGIGTHLGAATDDAAKLTVWTSGGANPRNNGVWVYNSNDAANQDAIVCCEVNDAGGNAFSSYKVTTGQYDGWAVGVEGETQKFKISSNAAAIQRETRLTIDNLGTVGINTDAPESAYKLHVDGDVKIGNFLAFKGVQYDQDNFVHSFIEERQYDVSGRSEILMFKGNDSAATGDGPDQIRHIAGQHVFQVYNSTSEIDQDIIDGMKDNENNITAIGGDTIFQTTPAALITRNRRLLLNENQSKEADIGNDVRLYVNGDIRIPYGSLMDFSNCTITSTATGKNFFDCQEESDLSFRFGPDGNNEKVRFTNDGNVCVGTTTATTLVNFYDEADTDVDVLTVESPAASTANKYAGIRVLNDPGFGGYLRAKKRSSPNANTFTLGVLSNDTSVDVMHFNADSNVGVGVSNPQTKFHVYDGTARVQHSTANAVVEFKTSHGTSNIYADRSGHLHIAPSSGSNVYLEGDLQVSSNISFGGRIELGTAVGVGIAEPSTTLHVNGGMITNSDNVACKRYSSTFFVDVGQGKNIKLEFGNDAFYAKVKAILRDAKSGGENNISTMVLEVQGGSSNGVQSSVPIAVGTKNVFGGANPNPWSPIVRTTSNQVEITPYNTTNTNKYYYDIYVKVISAKNGRLSRILANTSQKATYTY